MRRPGRGFVFFQSLPFSGQISANSFQRYLPEIHQSDLYFKNALKLASRVRIDPQISNKLLQQRKYSLMYLNELMNGLTVQLTRILESYRHCFQHLHPFEATVADLTITARKKQGHRDLVDILADVKRLRALTSSISKTYISLLKQSTTQLGTKVVLTQAQITLAKLYDYSETKLEIDNDVSASLSRFPTPEFTLSSQNYISELLSTHLALRRIPDIDRLVPTLVLVGAPNVGKSSIVRAVSSGTPEVANYPFTTRGLSVGHIISSELRIQVMDSPGLLDRLPEERNEMERLTFASLAHLPTAVIFVVDPTGLAGEKSTLAAQLNIRRNLRDRFPKRPWIDVCSKSDIPHDHEAFLLSELHSPLMLSSQTGEGIDNLKTQIIQIAFELSQKLRETSLN